MKRFAIVLASLILSFPIFSKEGYVRVSGGARLYYEEFGEGEPVIFLHGHPLDRRMWAEQVGYLKDSFRVINPDMRGYGKSDNPKEFYPFTYADDVVALMDSLKIEKAHIVGLSMGGYVAGDMVAIYPERLLSCTMVAGEICSRPGPSHPKTPQILANQVNSNAQHLKYGMPRYKQRCIDNLMRELGPRGEECRACLTEEIMEWDGWHVLHTTVRVYYGQDAMAQLKKKQPTVRSVIIYGDLEATTRSSMLDYMPNCSQLMVKECGHMVNMEQPEWFNPMLKRWLYYGTLNPADVLYTHDSVEPLLPIPERKKK